MDSIIAKQVYRQVKDDKGRDELIRAMDAIDHLKWQLPAGVAKQKWARLDIDTSGRDALKAATNVFSAYLPTWDITPRGPDDNVFAEKLERWLEWCYMRMNNRFESTVTWDVMKSAAKFDMVVARVEYLPHYIVGEPTKKQKIALRHGPFATRVFHPLTIHYGGDMWGVDWVGELAVYEAEEVISHWAVFDNENDKEKGGAKVSAAIKKLKNYIRDSGVDKNARVQLLDYTSLEKRYVVATKTNKETVDPELLLSEKKDDIIVLVDQDNDLPFFPWIIAVGGTSFEKGSENKIDPLLAPLHKANLWSNQNLHESLQTSKVLKRYGFPDMIIYTATGKKKKIDFSGEANTLNLKKGQEEAEAVTAPQMDLGLSQVVDRGRGRMSSTTGVKVLQDIDIGGNLQYATVQILLQMAIGQLTPYKNVAEKGLSGVGKKMLEWIEYTGDDINAFYMDDYGEEKDRKRGAQISIIGDDIDLESIDVKCELKANTPTDRQQRVNMAVLANEKLGVPLSELVEDLGFGSPEVLENGYIKESVIRAAVQSFIQKMAALDMAQVQSMLGGNEPSQQTVKKPSQANIKGDGFNQAAGGESPLQSDRNLTREGVTGRSRTGQGTPGAVG